MSEAETSLPLGHQVSLPGHFDTPVVQKPAKHLDHTKKEVVAARYFDIPTEAVERAAVEGGRA